MKKNLILQVPLALLVSVGGLSPAFANVQRKQGNTCWLTHDFKMICYPNYSVLKEVCVDAVQVELDRLGIDELDLKDTMLTRVSAIESENLEKVTNAMITPVVFSYQSADKRYDIDIKLTAPPDYNALPQILESAGSRILSARYKAYEASNNFSPTDTEANNAFFYAEKRKIDLEMKQLLEEHRTCQVTITENAETLEEANSASESNSAAGITGQVPRPAQRAVK